MTIALEHCPRCQHRWPPPAAPHEQFDCPGCGVATEVIRFAAALRPSSPSEPSEIAEGAVCFRHGTRRAHIVCPKCGRFACELCAVDASDEPLCAECFARELESGGPGLRYVSHVVQYDSLCLWMVLLPALGIITAGFTLFTAPLALALILFRWRRPMSVLPRSGLRRWVAALVAGGVTLAWLLFFAWLIHQFVRDLTVD